MRPLAFACAGLFAALALAGCGDSGPDVREIEIHIGYSADRKAQYLTPKEVTIKAGEKVRLVITNDDRVGAQDSFHDVAFIHPSGTRIEHEVPPAKTVKTCVPKAEPDRACAAGKDYFVIDKPGDYVMWCEVGKLGDNADGTTNTRHREMGMWGNLRVVA